MSYKEDISIDVTEMERECANHPTVHFNYGLKHADALRVRRQAELEEQEEQAAADARVRASLLGEKSTETAVKRLVDEDLKYKQVRRKALDAAHEVNVLAAALEALNAKTKMLNNLVTMQVAHWQAEPQTSYKQVRERLLVHESERQHAGLQDVAPRKKAKPAPVTR